jgi:hypothetical protein
MLALHHALGQMANRTVDRIMIAPEHKPLPATVDRLRVNAYAAKR